MLNLPGWRALTVLFATSCTLLVSATTTSAPPLLSIIENPVPGNTEFGRNVATGDVNGDGRDDFAVTARNGATRLAHVFDSSGGLLYTITGPTTDWSLAPEMADVNDDGLADVMTRSSQEGMLQVFSGEDGSQIHAIPNPAGSPQDTAFPFAIKAADLDGDGHADIVASDPSLEINGRLGQGRAYIFSGASGGLMRTIDSPNPEPGLGGDDASDGPQFGLSTSLGDINGDEVPDLLISAPLESILPATARAIVDPAWFVSSVPPTRGEARAPTGASMLSPCAFHPPEYVCWAGRAYIFDGLTGDLLTTLEDSTPYEGGVFGAGAFFADSDGNGELEVVLFNFDAEGSKTAAYSTENGALLRTLRIAPAEFVGDIDGDGKDDFVEPDTTHGVAGSLAGRALVEFGDSTKLPVVLNGPTIGGSPFFGTAMFGDVDGDSIDELVIGARGEDIGNANSGRAYVMCACDSDHDLDGFAGSIELHVGTETARDCHDGSSLPDWPPDFDNNMSVNIQDVNALKPVFGASATGTTLRYDLYPSSFINIQDINAIKPAFGLTCTP